MLNKESKNYFVFLDYPKNTQKLVCSTNVVENFNSVIEKIRVKSGEYFQSENLIYINFYLCSYPYFYEGFRHNFLDKSLSCSFGNDAILDISF
jgi:hypothetical protein